MQAMDSGDGRQGATSAPGIAVSMDRRRHGDEWYAQVRETYLAALRQAGGLPWGVPAGAAAVDLGGAHGLLLTGGGDLDPAWFGQPNRGTRMDSVSPLRDRTELALARAAAHQGLPVLGICRGMQVLAVAFGGSLLQDLGSAHEQELPRSRPAHAVRVAADSALAAIVGTTALQVNSFHHQAVDRLPDGWRAVAWAPDGVVEAMETVTAARALKAAAGGGWMLAVQWHPEDLVSHDEAARRLFAALVEQARALMRQREQRNGGCGG